MKKQCVLLAALALACGAPAGFTSMDSGVGFVAMAQTSTVTGTVTDANGEPVIGASVLEVGTTRGTATDVNGRFSLKTSGKGKIQVSYIGYKTVVLDQGGSMNVVLEEDNALLDEVVVVGYGQQKKVNLTGAVSVVDVDKTLSSRPEQDVAKALQGAVPGLSVISNSGSLEDSPSLTIRGVGTLSNGAVSNPLIVVDGVAVDDLSMINGADIATVSVLKDASSAAIYGTRAAFGVILITTKTGKKEDRINIRYDNNFAWDHATYLPNFPDVPTQLKAALMAKERQSPGASVELFGMYFDQLLPYAEKWKEQNSGKIGYGEMRPYVDENNVGDYRFVGNQPFYYADFDIQKIWYQNAAPSQSHNVSVDGSSGRTTFRAAFGYSGKEDLMPWNTGKRQRYNASVNFSTDVTDWLTVGARMTFNRRNMNRAEAYNNMYQYIWRWGSFFIPSGSIDGNDFRVIAMQKQADRRRIMNDELKATAFIRAHLTKDLTLNADFTYQVNNANMSWSDFPIYGMNWSGVNPGYIVGQSSSGTSRQNIKAGTWTGNAYLEYMKSINDAHNIKVMAGVTGEKRKYDYFRADRKELYSTDYPELNLAYGDLTRSTITSSTSGTSNLLPWFRGDYATAGYFARINYDYKGIYLFEVNGRYDGSSSFPASDRWAFFPSFSLGYRFSQEAYWDKIRDVVSNGKVRFSYGTIGNEAVGSNMFLSTIAAGQMNYLGTGTAKLNSFGIPTWVSPTLTWERIKTTNVGLDLGFLNDQITLTAEWFQRLTTDMLAPGAALPPSVGASTPYMNNGTLRSRGWEVTINWRKQINKDLGLYANFSIGDSKVKVTKWSQNNKLIGYPLNSTNAYEGMTWGDIWGFETDRYFTEADFNGKDDNGKWIYKDGIADQTGIQTQNFVYGPGDIKFKDLNNDGKIDGGDGTEGNHGDLKVIGNCLPRYEYSFRVGGTFKGFDLDLFFQGVGKRDMWTQSAFVFPMMREADLAIYANQTSFNVYDPENGVVNISESNDFPCLYPGNEYSGNVVGLAGEGGCHNYYPQTKYLVDMSYLRLKNVTLGYTLPTELTKKAYIQRLRFYASVNNLCLLHKGSGNLPIDPEMNAGQGALGYGTWGRTYPMTRSWSFGLQLTF